MKAVISKVGAKDTLVKKGITSKLAKMIIPVHTTDEYNNITTQIQAALLTIQGLYCLWGLFLPTFFCLLQKW